MTRYDKNCNEGCREKKWKNFKTIFEKTEIFKILIGHLSRSTMS